MVVASLNVKNILICFHFTNLKGIHIECFCFLERFYVICSFKRFIMLCTHVNPSEHDFVS